MRSSDTLPTIAPDGAVARPTDSAPVVSIGLAVYNGENFVASTIESILNQTFTDLELIITDNASTDRTGEICRAYATYHRHEKNLGAVANENFGFGLARGKYFRWLGHDDLCAPETIAECVAALESDPSAVLCNPAVIEIDGKGKPIGPGPWCDASSPVPHERFRNMIRMDHRCYEFYGLMRMDVLRAAREQQVYVDSDRTLLAELALRGRFLRLDRELFFRRIHAQKSTIKFPSWRDRMVWYDPAYATKLSLPFWMQFNDYIVRIARAPVSITEKARCFYCMIGWLRDGHGRSMVKDIVIVIQKLVMRAVSRLRR